MSPFLGFIKGSYLGENCILNFHLGRYIVRYMVGNLVLWRRTSRALKRDIRTYIGQFTSPNENFEYGYPHSNAFLQVLLKLERCNPHKAARHPTICNVINDVKLFPTVMQDILSQLFVNIQSDVVLQRLVQ